MIGTLLDHFRAAGMRVASRGHVTRKTFSAFKSVCRRLERGDMAAAERAAFSDLETRAMWYDATDAQRQTQAAINADFTAEREY